MVPIRIMLPKTCHWGLVATSSAQSWSQAACAHLYRLPLYVLRHHCQVLVREEGLLVGQDVRVQCCAQLL